MAAAHDVGVGVAVLAREADVAPESLAALVARGVVEGDADVAGDRDADGDAVVEPDCDARADAPLVLDADCERELAAVADGTCAVNWAVRIHNPATWSSR